MGNLGSDEAEYVVRRTIAGEQLSENLSEDFLDILRESARVSRITSGTISENSHQAARYIPEELRELAALLRMTPGGHPGVTSNFLEII